MPNFWGLLYVINQMLFLLNGFKWFKKIRNYVGSFVEKNHFYEIQVFSKKDMMLNDANLYLTLLFNIVGILIFVYSWSFALLKK